MPVPFACTPTSPTCCKTWTSWGFCSDPPTAVEARVGRPAVTYRVRPNGCTNDVLSKGTGRGYRNPDRLGDGRGVRVPAPRRTTAAVVELPPPGVAVAPLRRGDGVRCFCRPFS